MQKENAEKKRFADINTELSKRFNEGFVSQNKTEINKENSSKELEKKINKPLKVESSVIFFVGDEVEYKHPKKGLIKGEVVKVKRKKVIFKDKNQKEWDVVKEELKKL